MKIVRSSMTSTSIIRLLRYGTIPVSWALGGVIAGPLHLGMVIRGRWGHLAAAIAFAIYLGISLLGLATSYEGQDEVWGSILIRAALMTALLAAVSYAAGMSLRAAWTWRGDHRQAVAMSVGAITMLAVTVNLAGIPVQEARIESAKSQSEGQIAAMATAFVEAIAMEAEETKKTVDPEILRFIREKMLSTGIIGKPVSRLSAR